MPSFLSKITFPRIKSLYGRIFATFWLTLLLVLIAVLAAQHSDPRQQRSLPDAVKAKYTELAEDISQDLTRKHGSLQSKLKKYKRSSQSVRRENFTSQG